MSPSQLSIPSDHHHPSYGMPSAQAYHHANPYAPFAPPPPMPLSPTNSRKRRLSDDPAAVAMQIPMSAASSTSSMYGKQESPMMRNFDIEAAMQAQVVQPQMQQPLQVPPVAKKSRVNTPWTPAEEQRLKQLRDLGQSWNEIAKSFPNRTEGSVKKHWYKDMHYAEFAQDEVNMSTALLHAIRDYEASKWKVIGQKVGKPAKACEQYAKEHFTKEQIAGKAKDKDSSLVLEGGI